MKVFTTPNSKNIITILRMVTIEKSALKFLVMSVFIWQLYTQLFASSYIRLAYIFEASYSTVVTSVSEKSAKNQCRPIRTREIGGVLLSDVLYVILYFHDETFTFFNLTFKVGLSPSKQYCFICFNEKPFENNEKPFYFILKGLFVLEIGIVESLDLRPGVQDPGTWSPDTRDPGTRTLGLGTCESEIRNPEIRDLGPGTLRFWDMGPWNLNPETWNWWPLELGS